MRANSEPVDAAVLLQRLRETRETDRQDLLLRFISAMIRETLGLKAAEPFRPEQKLFELGLRSLNVIEIKRRLEAAFAVVLPVTLFFAYSTVGMLTDYLLTEVLHLSSSSQARAGAKPKESHWESTDLEKIEQLSEAETEALVLEKITELGKRLNYER